MLVFMMKRKPEKIDLDGYRLLWKNTRGFEFKQ